ncbi:F-box protein At3g07870-like [Mercurialis annua]|uniref:F-box protein At3g07870-like n=1 Tax=Mercurialis annua TaxID=3986 RepID=UPI00215F19F4|nr:F-box protein At3g07870-like [Mercurialis annua]
MKNKKTGKMFDYLAEDVIFQILSRLPAKSVLKFSCVCKLWNSIIKSPNFISTFSSNRHHPYILLSHIDCDVYKCSMRFDDKDFDEYVSLQPLCKLPSKYEVIGSSNGLVCLNYYESSHIYKLIIWNPCIRKSLVIPEPSYSTPFLSWSRSKLTGFGFDSRTNDYKLLLTDSINGVAIYSLNSNSWKKITTTGKYNKNYYRYIHSNPSAFIDGRFYWHILERSVYMLVFDLRDEMFREISLPAAITRDPFKFKIKAFEESLIAFIGEYDIWVMKEYVTGEWMHLATVGNEWDENTNVLEFRDNGEVFVLFEKGQRLASYTIMNRRRKNLIVLSSKYEKNCGYRHVESLALLDKGNAISNHPPNYGRHRLSWLQGEVSKMVLTLRKRFKKLCT